MGQEYYTTKKRKKGSHWTVDDRKMLSELWNWPAGKDARAGVRDIGKLAVLFEKCQKTIKREIARGWVKLQNSDLTMRETYHWRPAQNKADAEKKNHGPAEAIGKDHELAKAIADKIKIEHWSPYATIEWFKNGQGWPGTAQISYRTVYRYIDKGMIPNCSAKDLYYGGKRQKKRGKPREGIKIEPPGHSITDRPKGADDRSEVGHWEQDTVLGCKGGGLERLMTLTDRKHRLEIACKIPNGTAEAIVTAVDCLETMLGSQFASVVKSFTPDHGSEFADWEGIERSCLNSSEKRLNLFYAHAYRACERGTNENHNGMLRRFFPKGTDFSKVTDEEVCAAVRWMNNYPRKILGGLTPSQSFLQEFRHNPLISSTLTGML
jgi:IS30 family transposase